LHLEVGPPRGRLIARNIGALVASQGITKALNLAVSVLLVRWLGPDTLGDYAYITAFAYPFGALTDLGLGLLVIREISKAPDRTGPLLTLLRRLLLALAALSAAALLATALLTGHGALVLQGLAIIGLSGFLTALTAPRLVLLTAREQMHLLSLFQVTASTLGSLAILGVLLWGGGVLALLGGAACTNLAMLAVARGLTGRQPAATGLSLGDYGGLLVQALPFGAVLLGFTLYYRLDMVLLGWLCSATETGHYAAAHRFLDALLVLGASVGAPFYPRLSSLVGRDPKAARDLLEVSWRAAIALGLPLVAGSYLVAAPLTTALFGPQYASTIPLVRILIWAGLPVVLIAVPGHGLNAAGRSWWLAGVYGVAVACNAGLDLLLIPRWGAQGASWATVVGAWLCLGLVVRQVRRIFGARLGGDGAWRYLAAAAGMAALIHWPLRDLPLLVLGPLAAAAYAAGLVCLGIRRTADFAMAKRLLAQ